ncbi:SGNH/GDSL hydrolase family protein [Nonomuraea sp. PA05]|uniref:GDSL-type esterase/lipase family protein n=1 Tax=Nonomuraea sp. PA05 TaxID=2604466 RepID=UPI0011D359D3|nr:GDSL-type esterase/lipase family protein [Nonomuraea sp. PA05]TYB50650.1 SGNH/GDSL hydrolase family protein [Nonomuraea sp. PA05]
MTDAGEGRAWVAGFRSGVISPYEQIKLAESRGFRDETVRQALVLAGGGDQVRVRLTNRYGRAPLTIGAVRVALRPTGDGFVPETGREARSGDAAGGEARSGDAAGGGVRSGDAIVPGTEREVRFGGAGEVTIPAGGEVVGDPVELVVRAGEHLVLSLYVPGGTEPATFSHQPMETAYVAPGDQVSAPALPGAEQVAARFYVSGVDVRAPRGTSIGVAFGDSWFEGVGTTMGADRRSVDVLNARLPRGWVVNQGIAGNRLLVDEIGEHGLARLERDALSVPGATHVLVHFGINDLGLPGMAGAPPATAEDLIAGFTELGGRVRAAGMRVLAATIGPFAGAIYPGVSTPEGVAARRRVNEWIRTGAAFDGVFDVAKAVEKPDEPDFIRPEFDAGDGMHLNDVGAQAMGAAVNLADLLL